MKPTRIHFLWSNLSKPIIKRRILNSSVKVAAYYYSSIVFIAREKGAWFTVLQLICPRRLQGFYVSQRRLS